MKKSRLKTNRDIFFWPLIIGIASCAGLISALVADGVWNFLSWLLLAIPLLIGAIAPWRHSANKSS